MEYPPRTASPRSGCSGRGAFQVRVPQTCRRGDRDVASSNKFHSLQTVDFVKCAERIVFCRQLTLWGTVPRSHKNQSQNLSCFRQWEFRSFGGLERIFKTSQQLQDSETPSSESNDCEIEGGQFQNVSMRQCQDRGQRIWQQSASRDAAVILCPQLRIVHKSQLFTIATIVTNANFCHL